MSSVYTVRPRKTRRVKTVLHLPVLKPEHYEHIYIPHRTMLSLRGLESKDLAGIDTDVYVPMSDMKTNLGYAYKYSKTITGRMLT